ncbi:MAG: copper homeostasis protein CutC [Bacteroidota bacterium]
MKKGIIEICCNSLQSSLNAQQAGADRIELCSGLMEGGMTPSLGLIEEVIAQLTIPVYVLVRPRGGDFCFTNEEIKVMLRDIEWCKQSGVKGIVSGVLNDDVSINREKTQLLMHAASPLDFTFHRAFDVVNDPMMTIQILKSIGCKRILTSGGSAIAYNVSRFIKEFVNAANPEISIMSGGGVDEKNIQPLIRETGIHEVHFSATAFIKSYSDREFRQTTSQTDLERATQLVQLARQAFAQ